MQRQFKKMMTRTATMTFFVLFCFASEAQIIPWPASVKPHLEKWRAKIQNILGEEWTVKLLGDAPKPKIELPAIPKISEDAKSTAVYDRKEDTSKFNITPDQYQKYNLAFIEEVILETRLNKANDNDLAKWMNTMEQGASREGIYRALVLDSVYAGLENYEAPVSPGAVDFSVKFLEKFINQGVKKEAVDKFNFYTLKRIVTEKALEIVDEYYSKPEDLFKWYAVLSSDLAEQHPTIWNNELRRDPDGERHLKWAASVPNQFIKSEVIIKLHKALNHLNRGGN